MDQHLADLRQQFLNTDEPTKEQTLAAYILRDQELVVNMRDHLWHTIKKLGLLDNKFAAYANNCDNVSFYNDLTLEQLVYAGY